MPSITGHCPHWCSRDHSAGPSGTAFYHASDTTTVAIAGPGGLTAPNRLDVQTAQYLPDDPGEPAWSPTVEIAVHAGDRYRLIGLTPEEARQLAAMLAEAADIVERGVTSAAVSRSRDATVRASPRPAAQCPAPRLPPPGYPPPPNFSSSAV